MVVDIKAASLINREAGLDYLKSLGRELKFADYVALHHKMVKSTWLDDLPEYKIAVLRTITIEPIQRPLEVEVIKRRFKPTIYLSGYNQIQQEILDSNSGLYQFNPDMLVIMWWLEDIAPQLLTSYASLSESDIAEQADSVTDYIAQTIESLRKQYNGVVLVSDFVLSQSPVFGIFDPIYEHSQIAVINNLNLQLSKVCKQYPNTYILSLSELERKWGRSTLYSPKMYRLSKAPFSQEGITRLSQAISIYLEVLEGVKKKCIVLDLDNTLWGGIVSEDGLDGVQLGTEYPGNCYFDFQQSLLQYLSKGFLLAVNSKNNEDDALEMFQNHPYQILKEEHFSAIKINWKDKVTNLKEIAEELNIGTESLIFIDDNPVECALVEHHLPEVLTIQVPKEPYNLKSFLSEVEELQILSLTTEDKRKTELYKANVSRNKLRKQHVNLESFYTDLDMTLNFHSLDIENNNVVERLAQLTQKTNQFNLTMQRYSQSNVIRMVKDASYRIYYFRLLDKFGDNGIVGVAIIKLLGEKEACFDTFLQSCRVIGRTAERNFLGLILEKLKIDGVEQVWGKYSSTPKNRIVSSFWEDNGFHLVNTENNTKTYFQTIKKLEVQIDDWFKIRDFTA